jgi:hypothetical protein
LVLRDETAWKVYLAKLPEGEEIRLRVMRKERTRSVKQNAWYWGCILPIFAEHTGHTVEEIHEIMKRLFLQRKIVSYRGREIPMPGSTSNLSVQEFSEYCERVRAEAASLGLNIPDPDGISL